MRSSVLTIRLLRRAVVVPVVLLALGSALPVGARHGRNARPVRPTRRPGHHDGTPHRRRYRPRVPAVGPGIVRRHEAGAADLQLPRARLEHGRAGALQRARRCRRRAWLRGAHAERAWRHRVALVDPTARPTRRTTSTSRRRCSTTTERSLCIDPDRVYSTGISNGAMLSTLLACRLPGKLAAIAPVAGVNVTRVCPRRRRE